MTLESHPLLEQVQALQSFELQVMYVDGEHARHQAQRSKLLAAALARLEANPRDKIDDPARWKKTLGMLAEVATMQMAAAGRAANARGSLDEYCLDGHAEAYSQLSQGLAASVRMFENFPYDSYEAHVALRTVRTIDAIERISPLQRVAWKYDPDAPARRTEEAVKAQEERRLREAMEEMMVG